jgi:hypothetical protein
MQVLIGIWIGHTLADQLLAAGDVIRDSGYAPTVFTDWMGTQKFSTPLLPTRTIPTLR